jgi:hypothetical protein
MNTHEVLERAGLTFAEYALVTIVAAGTNLINVALWKAAALAGVAGLASFLLNWIRSKKSTG